jgi:predicted AlkP superfamily pyrophosphatase or phosphodiesterase
MREPVSSLLVHPLGDTLMRWILQSKLRAAGLLFLTAALAFLFWPIQSEVPAGEPKGDAPKLVVLVVFDQMRGDYLKRWEELYGDGGFKRLMKDGAWFTNCHYPYAFTLTAPGHASLATGCSPDKHGIVANDWYSRDEAAIVSSTTPPPNELRKGGGPYRRLQSTFADSLMGVSKKSKVASLSIKERAAIMLAALHAQICYWFNSKTGNFVTSPFYREDPHGWVTQFNKSKPADVWRGTSWERLHPKLDYARYSGPDDFPAEGSGYEQGQIFPHPFVQGSDPKRSNYYNAITNSPMGNVLLLALAKRAIEAEMLGQRDATDVLCLSFSSNDSIGHCWGPDSQEVLDVTLRSDVLMKELMDYLDTKVGKDRYVMALSADHGICPLPEFARRQGKEAGRVIPELLTTQAEAFLNKHFLKDGQKASWFETARSNSWVYFNRATLKDKDVNVTEAAAEKALADWLVKQPGVQSAFTRTELLEGPLADPIGRMVQKSFYPDRSGDVIVVLRPYHLFSQPLDSKTAAYRTTHGSPHPYDTHVPLLVMGPGIAPGQRTERVTPQAMASILARAMGVPAPKGAEAPVPDGLFRK